MFCTYFPDRSLTKNETLLPAWPDMQGFAQRMNTSSTPSPFRSSMVASRETSSPQPGSTSTFPSLDNRRSSVLNICCFSSVSLDLTPKEREVYAASVHVPAAAISPHPYLATTINGFVAWAARPARLYTTSINSGSTKTSLLVNGSLKTIRQ